MTDLAKRKTLKTIAATTAYGMAATLGGAAVASAAEQPYTNAADTADLANINVTTRLSPLRNDLEVVLTNSGSEDVTITAMTPRTTVVPRGEFDFASLLRDGPLRLPRGASVAVPLQQSHVCAASPIPSAGHSLTDSLRKSLSIVTDGSAFASVTVREMSVLA